MRLSITRFGIRFSAGTLLLASCLLTVVCVQAVPGWGDAYAQHVYPPVARTLSAFSRLVPFAVGDLFIALSIIGVLLYPVYARRIRHRQWKRILLADAKYLLWMYVWFYAAWGLNYSQGDFYQRTRIPPSAYSPERFEAFACRYIDSLNRAYALISDTDTLSAASVCRETVRAYRLMADSLGIHRPFHPSPRAKTMLFTPLSSKVGVTGSMAPFFCEFTLNGDLPPLQYPATYAHEFAHWLGITSEAEANFYAYQACIRSQSRDIRFSGYFSLLPHVLSNARRLMDEAAYTALTGRIRTEIKELYARHRAYWTAKYSPLLGEVQDFIYDLYLKGNRIQSGRKNYSEVVGLLITYEEWKNQLCAVYTSRIIDGLNQIDSSKKRFSFK